MINKTFLILLLAGISYTAYNATAVSENFEISTTIDHEVVLGNSKTASADANLDVTSDIDMGTIYINPNATADSWWTYHGDGTAQGISGNTVVKADNITFGTFNANIPDPESCNSRSLSCGGLSAIGNNNHWINGLFGKGNSCQFYIQHLINNTFAVSPNCFITDISTLTTGVKTGVLTISYDPE
ncbi:MAG: hypothetical protein IJ689_00135 [Alphaproteobacteria bacterium]|nr:hypothetical protein [Alphaproteobacteria bacterium]